METVQGHEENQSIWAMCMTPDRVRDEARVYVNMRGFFFFQQAFLTGGGDKKIQFWNLELKNDQETNLNKVCERKISSHDGFIDDDLDEKTFII